MSADVGASSLVAAGGGSSSATTGAITTNVSASSFLIFVIWYIGPGSAGLVGTVSDTINGSASGNTYTQIGTDASFGGLITVQLFKCENGNGGVNHVAATSVVAGSSPLLGLIEVTGAALSSAVDQVSSPLWNDDVASPFTANAITITQASELILAFTSTGTVSGTEVLTWGGSGGTFVQVQAEGDAARVTGAVAKLLVSAIATYNVSFTSAGAGTTECQTALVSFKSASGGSTPVDEDGDFFQFIQAA